ncbi:MAG TPA: type 1 glutamine amidotransferase [Coriobacteriia bacterium]
MRIICLQHVDYEGPDKIGDWARERGHTLRTVMPLLEQYPDVSDFDFLVVMGGPMGAYEDATYPWLAAEKRFIARAIEAGRSVFGVCLGCQLVAEAIGGRAHPHDVREVGWLPVTLTPTGQFARALGTLPERFVAGEWHGDTYDLPDHMRSAAVTDTCGDQAFELEGGRVVGVQFHLEWTPETLVELVERHGDWLAAAGEGTPSVQTAHELLTDLPALARGHELLYALLDRMAVIA